MQKNILNLVIFQVGWLVCVIGGNLYALSYTVLALLLHSIWVLERKSEWQLIALITVVGCLWDILMTQTDLIVFADPVFAGLPVWLACLWILFATTFLHVLAWFRRHLWVAAIAAAVFAPASYWVGVQLGGAIFAAPVLISLLVMAIGWAALFAAGLYLSKRYQ